jgi:amidase
VIDSFSSATAMRDALRAGDISAVELLDLHLERIDRVNPEINAIIARDDGAARKRAAEADEARASGFDAPLLGLPLTVKDEINVAGFPCTNGQPRHAERYPEADAVIVARLREAGAVILGKTNLPTGADDYQSANPLFGRTLNPWDLGRSPGGSTGGGAAALAAGLTPLEFGGDLGGSIRVPAAFCGVYGHRPSETALPRTGFAGASPLPNAAAAMSVAGPLARHAEDLELALDVVAGPDVGEDVAWRLEIPPARHERLAEYRVAMLPSYPWLPVDDEILAAQERLTGELQGAGLHVAQAQPDGFDDLREQHALYLTLLAALVNDDTSEEGRRNSAAWGEETLESPWLEAYLAGIEGRAPDYLAWHERRELVRDAYRRFFREWDILIAPVNITNAFPHVELGLDWKDRSLEVNGRPASYFNQVVYAGVATLAGQPSTAFPCGLTRGGLPIGLQAIGPYLEDRTTIRFAQLLAAEFGGFQAPPEFRDRHGWMLREGK